MRTTPLLLLSSIVALPALAQDQAPPIRFYIDGGYGSTNQQFDNGGEKIGASIELMTARAGAAYDFMQIGDLGLGAHVDFSMANVEIDSRKSGFKPQNVGIGLHLEAPRYGMHAGYMLDLGPSAELSGSTVTIPNTDQLDAVNFGGKLNTFFNDNLRVFGNADYFVTMKGDVDVIVQGQKLSLSDVNYGDWVTAQAGVGFRPTEGLEVGAKLAYQYQWEGESMSILGASAPSNAKSSNFSIIPFVSFNQPNSPLTFYAEGRADREYGPIGYSFSGNNSPMGKTGVVVGLKYSFRADQTGR